MIDPVLDIGNDNAILPFIFVIEKILKIKL